MAWIILSIISYPFLWFLNILLLARTSELKKRISDLETQVRRLATPTTPITPDVATEEATRTTPSVPEERQIEAPKPQPKVAKPRPQTAGAPKAPRAPSSLSLKTQSLRDNWVGIFGALLIVLGAGFFGLSSEWFRLPLPRVIALFVFSSALFLAYLNLRSSAMWRPLGEWLRASSGAIALLAAVGAGGIPGLQCIANPWMAFALVIGAVGFNLYLSRIATNELSAFLHSAFSIAGFSVLPHSALVLPVASAVGAIGCVMASRRAWNTYQCLTIISFSALSCYHLCMGGPSFLGAGSALLLGATVLLAPLPQNKPQGLFSHFLTVILTIATLMGHACTLAPLALLLLALAVLLWMLGVINRRRGFLALYRSDILLGQLAWLGAVLSFHGSGLLMVDHAWVALVSSLIFAHIVNREGDEFLCKAADGLIIVTFTGFVPLFCSTVWGPSVSSHLAAALRPVSYALLAYAYVELSELKAKVSERLFPLSIAAVTGTIALVLSGCVFNQYRAAQFLLLLLPFALDSWSRRTERENTSWNVSFLLACVGAFLPSLYNLCVRTPIHLNAHLDLLGLAPLMLALIYAQGFSLRGLRYDVQHYAVWASALGLATLLFSNIEPYHPLVPGIFCLLSSLLYIELARSRKWCALQSPLLVPHTVYVASALMGIFVLQHLLVHLQYEGALGYFSIRQAITALGTVGLGYFLAAFPRQESVDWLRQSCMELMLGFVVLTLYVEVPAALRAPFWALMTLSLAAGVHCLRWPRRMECYAWMTFAASLVSIGFVYHSTQLPAIYPWEGSHVPNFLTIAFQVAYLAWVLLYRHRQGEDKGELVDYLYKHADLTFLLAACIGFAFYLSTNFDRGLLTLLWVALTLCYYTTGLWLRSKTCERIATVALLLCCARLLLFDFTHSSLAIRSLVFSGAGILMLSMSVISKKFRQQECPV